LRRLAERMASGDFFLLGADLIKDIGVIELAYNDPTGITAEFNRNILSVINKITGSDFEPRAYDHSARYNPILNRIEMYLIASAPQRVRLPALNLEIAIQQGESLLTEISCKYDRSKIETMLEASGFRMTRWFTDPDELFALALAQKT